MTKVLAADDPTAYAQAKSKTHWEQVVYWLWISFEKQDLVSVLWNNLVCCKWVYKTKFTIGGQIAKYKDRLVVKGFNPLEGIDYNETFLLLLKWTQ